MDDLAARVTRLQAAAWAVRRAAPRPCALPFALAVMTDEQAHPDLVSLLERLPGASGRPILVVFRHHGLPAAERAALAGTAYRTVRAGGHLMVVAGGGRAGDGAHNAPSRGLVTASVHDLAEGARRRATLAPALGLVSPVLPTASHPGAPALGAARAAAVAARLPYPCFALGGMDAVSARRLVGAPFQGVAALGAFRT